MQCRRDQADAAKHIGGKHIGMSPSAGEGARMQSVRQPLRIPGRFRPEFPRYSISLAGHASLGQPLDHTGGAV